MNADAAAGSGEPTMMAAVEERPRAERDEERDGYDQEEGAQQGHVHEGSSALVPEPGVVSAADVLSQLEESHEEPGQEVSAEGSGSKQTNLMHWLK